MISNEFDGICKIVLRKNKSDKNVFYRFEIVFGKNKSNNHKHNI